MNTYLKDGRLPSEKNDCTVIALSYAFNIDYLVAHKLCKDAGRIDKHGFHLRDVLNVSKNKKSRTFLGRRVGYHGRPKMTVGRFKDNHKAGIYILRVGGHIFAMIDGVIFNQHNMKDKISYYYYISKPK